jgi:hypothetical protein
VNLFLHLSLALEFDLRYIKMCITINLNTAMKEMEWAEEVRNYGKEWVDKNVTEAK